MSIFGKLIKATLDTALLPIDIAKDIVTMGGVLTDQDGYANPYTVKKAKKLKNSLQDIYDSIDEL